jgi:hypothetical protein
VVRASPVELARVRSARAHEPWYSLPDPRLVFLGGEDVYRVELGLCTRFAAPYAASVAHRLILERFGRIRSPTTVSLVVTLATKSKAKKHALAWLEAHRDFAATHLDLLAAGTSPLAVAARALLPTLA